MSTRDVTTEQRDPLGVARMRRWLDTLPPPLAKLYAELKAMDPKGAKRPPPAGGAP